MSEVWTGSKCAVLTGAREAKSLDHLAKYVPLGQLVGELAQVVVGVQQARDGVTLAVAGGERGQRVAGHLLSPPGLRSGANK